jgi:hypothetical protein
LRKRLKVAGDLDPAAVENDMHDSCVEAAVRRFQTRPGQFTLNALNSPAQRG